MANKLTGEKGSWFEWEQWKKMVSLGLRNLTPKLLVVEDADGRLSISEKSVPTIEWKDKEADEYERHRMGYSG